MSKSLQEQLFDAGLVDSKQVKKANIEKRKKAKRERNGDPHSANTPALIVKQQRLEKSERDRKLNRERMANAQRIEVAAQIKLLVEKNRESQDDNGIAYNFEDNNKLRRIYVSDTTRKKIISGQLAIVKYKQRYEIVPAEVARKIEERDSDCLIKINDRPAPSNGDNDPYSAYPVPDDLIW